MKKRKDGVSCIKGRREVGGSVKHIKKKTSTILIEGVCLRKEGWKRYYLYVGRMAGVTFMRDEGRRLLYA